MANKRPVPEETVSKLRLVEVLMGQGQSRLNAIRRVGVVEQSHSCWRKQFAAEGATGPSRTRDGCGSFEGTEAASARE